MIVARPSPEALSLRARSDLEEIGVEQRLILANLVRLALAVLGFYEILVQNQLPLALDQVAFTQVQARSTGL